MPYDYIEEYQKQDDETIWEFRDKDAQEKLSTDYATVEGNPLNFTTLSAQKSKSTILSVEPIQDLHGYDYPWVGGAGKNILNLNWGTAQTGSASISISDETVTASCSGEAEYESIKWNKGLTNSDNFTTGTYYIKLEVVSATNYSLGTTFGFRKRNGNQRVDSINITQSGTYTKQVTITEDCYLSLVLNGTGASALANQVVIKNIIVSTTDVPFEPYTNLCPISGRTEIGILGCGKNIATTQIYKQDYVIASNGSENASAGYCITDKIFIDNTKDYYLTFTKQNPSDPDPLRVGCYDKNGEFLERKGYVTSNSKITFSEQTSFIRLSYANNSSQQSYIYDIQLEENSATTYSPYTESNDITISFGQTVYGGTLDIENGVLVVDRKTVTISDFTDFVYQTFNNFKALFVQVSNLGITDNSVQAEDIHRVKFNEFEQINSGTAAPFGKASLYNSNDGTLYLWNNDNHFADGTEFKTFMNNNPLEMCYYLATPTTIQLTPNEISLLEGVNNISTTGDKITLTYRDGKVATLGDLLTKVDKETGKSLSSNDYTDSDKAKVDTIEYKFGVENGIPYIEEL